MTTALKSLHQWIGIALLFILLGVLIAIFLRMVFKKPFEGESKIIALIGLYAVYVETLLGLVLYLFSPLGFSNLTQKALAQPESHYFLANHPLGMLFAALLFSIGYRITKKNSLTDRMKHTRIFVLYSIGYGIMVSTFPWFLWD